MAIRILSVEVKQIGESKESDQTARTRLKELCEQVQEATNYFWSEWFCWHRTNGSEAKIREWQAEWIKYKNKERDKPKLDVVAMPKELSNLIYHGVSRGWPELQIRVVVLMLNRLSSGVASLKASRGSFAGWHAILLHRQAIPSFTKPLPLLFDKDNTKMFLPASDDDSHRIELKLAREEVAGKTTKASVVFDCLIWDRGRQMAGRRQTLKLITRGEYPLKGSHLVFDRGKCFAQLTYEIPEVPKSEATGTALITPGRRHPMLMKLPNRNGAKWIGGDGRVVTEVRRQLLCQRLGRKSAYRQCPTSNSRGHGRTRGIEKVTKLSRRWRDFVTTYSRNMAAAIVAECQRRDIGTVILGRPKKDSRYLSNTGVDDRRDSTSWDWFGLERRIADKCSSAGITFISRGEKARTVEGGVKFVKAPCRKAKTAKSMEVVG